MENTKVDLIVAAKAEADNKRTEMEKAIVSEVTKGNEEQKSAIKSLTNSIKDLVDLQKKSAEVSLEQKTFKLNNGESKSIKHDDVNSFEMEVKKVANRIIRGKSSAEEKSLFESKTFNDYVLEKAKERTFGSDSDARKVADEIKTDFETARALSKGQVIPLLETKGDTFRSSIGEDGGYLMRPNTREILKEIQDVQKVTMRDVANVQTVNTGAYENDLEFEGVTTTWKPEETAANGSPSKPSYGKVVIQVGELTACGKITRKALEDSSIDLYQRLLVNSQNAMRKAEEVAFLTGNGENDRPYGLFNATKYTDIAVTADYAKDKFRCNTFNAGGTLATDVLAMLDAIQATIIRLETLNPDDALQIYMNPETYTVISQLKATSGEYIIDRYGMPTEKSGIKMLFGKPIILSYSVPTMITSAAVVEDSRGIFVGNLEKVYTIVDRLSLVSWADIITDQSYIRSYMRKRVGGGAEGFNSGEFIKESGN